MAELDKLAIRGVRAFDPKSINIIQFFKPLTVIVGHNGSGKTTIVECLKYAATGDLPPNTKGGAFVYDPFVSRKRGGGLTMKTLEGVLGIDDSESDHAQAAISTRCAELDQEMTLLLGVSRAILEHVLFCHQEESNWPLAEPFVLKKRFDEIFEVTRYTKALDSLRALRKQRIQDSRVDEAELRGLQQEKERAESARQKIRSLHASLEHHTADLTVLEQDLAKKTVENKALYDAGIQFREIIGKAESLEERHRLYCEKRDEIATHTSLLQGTDDAIRNELEAFADTLSQQRAEHTEITAQLGACKETRDNEQHKHEMLIREHGEVLAAHKALKRTIQSSMSSLYTIAAHHGINVPEEVASLDAFRTLHASLQTQLSAQHRTEEARLRREEHSAQEREAVLEQEWQQARTMLQEKQAQCAHQEETVACLDQRISATEQELAQAQATSLEERDISEAEDKVASLSAQLDAPDFAAQRAETAAALTAAETRREALAKEMSVSHQTIEQRTLLASREDTLQRDRKALHDRMATLETEAQSLLGETPDAATFFTVAADALATCAQALQSAAARQQKKQQAVDRLQSVLELDTTQAKSKEAQCSILANELASLLNGEFNTIDVALDVATEEVSVLKDSMAMVERGAEFFQKILVHGKEKHVCLGCNRGIALGEIPAFTAHVQASLARSNPERLAELRTDLENWTAQLNAFETGRAKAQERTFLLRELSTLHTHQTECRTALEDAHTALEDASHTANTLRTRHARLQTLTQGAEAVESLYMRCQALQRSVDNTRADLRVTGDIPQAGDARKELDLLSVTIQQHRAMNERLNAQRETLREQLSSKLHTLHTLQKAVADAHRQDMAYEAAKQRLAELAADCAKAREKSERLQSEIDAQAAPIAATREALHTFRAEQRKTASDASEASRAQAQALVRMDDIAASVDSAAADLPKTRLEACNAMLQESAQRLHTVRASVDAMEEKAHALALTLQEAQAHEATLSANLRYREAMRDIAVVEAQLSALDLDTAHQRHATFAEHYDAARKAENDMSGKAAHLRGELRGIEAQIKEREDELRSEYRDVDVRYMRQLIRLKVGSMANRDLETYSGALHQAIQQYHAIKMEEVNQTLDYLWKKTYQGADIDTILIRSDVEGKVNASGVRSYQYRVVMVKDGAELDMRGRCSAGQKVLACILIRLALADSFGTNTGFLALDEPTTNLDRENVEALAASLVDLIAERQHQHNFQLVVITHDEDFLSRLSHSDALTQYWRVSRNEHLNSVIEREYVRNM
ncbi:DNA repair protein rad50 [Malassezia vespertilionis]|uniref:DNA repair protein rad50 n=1 Tax=Malassezia vespertilionis TaxID=2020962 RepID=UPI0024B10FD9|nr:DNA repair protein rad50 [Malassezia vespertilionis]WFD08302.1 DNA repair protein rad50 [Malassezia vespertilionis]